MRRLVPQPEEVQDRRDQEQHEERRQEGGGPDAERGRARAERHRPEPEQSGEAQRAAAQLVGDLAGTTPLLRRHGQPFDAAALGEQQRGHDDQPEPDPDGPPIFLAEEADSATRSGQVTSP